MGTFPYRLEVSQRRGRLSLRPYGGLSDVMRGRRYSVQDSERGQNIAFTLVPDDEGAELEHGVLRFEYGDLSGDAQHLYEMLESSGGRRYPLTVRPGADEALDVMWLDVESARRSKPPIECF